VRLFTDLDRALSDVQRELSAIGLDDLIDRVDIEESYGLDDLLTGAYGLFWPGARHRRIIGRITVPAFNLDVLNWFGGSRTSLRFVLRHEYGHALAHRLGLLGRPGRPWGMGAHVSSYALTNPDEDLAETVALHLTHRGRFPYRRRDPDLLAKWRAAGALLRAGRSRNHNP
jgi:hypothetical protein